VLSHSRRDPKGSIANRKHQSQTSGGARRLAARCAHRPRPDRRSSPDRHRPASQRTRPGPDRPRCTGSRTPKREPDGCAAGPGPARAGTTNWRRKECPATRLHSCDSPRYLNRLTPRRRGFCFSLRFSAPPRLCVKLPPPPQNPNSLTPRRNDAKGRRGFCFSLRFSAPPRLCVELLPLPQISPTGSPSWAMIFSALVVGQGPGRSL